MRITRIHLLTLPLVLAGMMVLAGALAVTARTAPRAAGDLDPSFGNSGVLTIPFGSMVFYGDMARQSDGKFVLVGEAFTGSGPATALARVTNAGQIDPGFGGNGRVLSDIAIGARSVQVQPDDKIVIGGHFRVMVGEEMSSTFGLARFSPAGSLDTSFGDNGRATLRFGAHTSDTLTDMLIQPDGKLLVAGRSKTSRNFSDVLNQPWVMARFEANGQLDPTFGNGGTVVTGIFAPEYTRVSLARLADGRILLAGTTWGDFAVARFSADGILDTSFGNNGLSRVDFEDNHDEANAILVQQGGKIVLAGAVSANSSRMIGLARFDANGQLDSTFGREGKVFTSLRGSSRNEAYALAEDTAGRLVVAGSFDRPFASEGIDFALLRYLANGALDASFGNGGLVATAFSERKIAYNLAIEADGKIVLAGGVEWTHAEGHGYFAMARYEAEGGAAATATASATAISIPSATASPFPSATAPSATPSAVPSATASPVPSATSSPTASATATPVPSATPSATASPVPSATSVPPTPTTTASCIFSDVCPGAYFFIPVQELVRRGAISGYNDNTFRPFNETTRGQMAKIIVLAAGFPLANPTTATFRDVPRENTFFQFVETAAERNIVAGYTDGTFRPFNNVTRGQLAKIVVVARGWPLANPPTPTFADVPRENAFYTFVETAYEHRIISGYDDGTFRWGNNATRGQIAKIVYQAISE